MADSLTLKGTKHVVKHTGDEMQLVRPKRGGDTHQVPRWWALKNKVNYVSAAIFNVTTSGGELALVVPLEVENTELEIRSAGDGTFSFGVNRGVDRVAVMAADLSAFYVEYQFSKISGGPTLKRTVNEIPAPAPDPDPDPDPPENVVVPFADRVAAATFTYNVTVVDGNYLLNGVANAGIAGSVGDSIHFDLSDASLSGHPLKIYTDATKTTEVTVGVEQEGTDLLFAPPIAGTFSYQCQVHADMGGDITIT